MHGKGSTVEARVKASAGLVATFLQSWSGASPSPLASDPELTPSHAGLFYLNIHGRQALTSLVDSLTNPSQVIRVRRSDLSSCPSQPPATDALLPQDTLLDMLFDVFNVKLPARQGASRSPRRARAGRSLTL